MDTPATHLPEGVASRFVDVRCVRTHYLEAGAGEPVILLHSAEFGGRAELSWRSTIGPLAQHFHVYAPDFVGFGRTEKLFNFSDRDFRTDHVRSFMDTLGIPAAHFVGNSFGGSLALTVAAKSVETWPMKSIIGISSGGFAPDNDARKVLTQYDGTREGMKRILQVMFWDSRWWADDLVEEHWRASIEPGAWEAVAAARLARPGQDRGFGSERGDVSHIRVPVLITGGREDLLREPGCWEALHAQIPGSEFHVFSPARHCPHIEHADAFNALAIDFLRRHSTT